MNYGPLIFLGILVSVVASWWGMVFAPSVQLGDLQPKAALLTEEEYPVRKAGVAAQGREIYISEGCMYCHSQQIQPPGLGADIAREWGTRRSVAQDYLYEERLQTGHSRLGGDLAAFGARQTNVNWVLLHLYNPRIHRPGSMMPPYPYLFEKRKSSSGHVQDALALEGEFAPPAGYVVVPKPEAYKLARYLISLNSTAALFEVPPKIPATNAPGGSTNSVAADGTNAAPASVTNSVPANGTNAPAATAPVSNSK